MTKQCHDAKGEERKEDGEYDKKDTTDAMLSLRSVHKGKSHVGSKSRGKEPTSGTVSPSGKADRV